MASGEIQVVEVELAFRPTAGPAEPLVWQTEDGAVVVFETDARTQERRGVLQFQGCLQAKFGYPNDEALPGHPLGHSGLGYYGLFEVRGSAWLAELGEQNRVAFPASTWPPRPFRHFVLTFHDSTFEALCMNVGGHATNETLAEVFARLGPGDR
jgi:hypothetical protein